jgi:hypothetical protein
MQIERREKRQYIANALLNTIPDVLISTGLAWFFSGGSLGFIVAFIAIQLVYLLIWLKDSIWQWLMFNWRGRKALDASIQQMLISAQFPKPAERYGAVDDYFMQVMSDESAPTNARLVSAVISGWHTYTTSAGRYQEALRMNLALEDALMAYSTRMPLGN